jgi:hypothetical protein
MMRAWFEATVQHEQTHREHGRKAHQAHSSSAHAGASRFVDRQGNGSPSRLSLQQPLSQANVSLQHPNSLPTEAWPRRDWSATIQRFAAASYSSTAVHLDVPRDSEGSSKALAAYEDGAKMPFHSECPPMPHLQSWFSPWQTFTTHLFSLLAAKTPPSPKPGSPRTPCPLSV